MHFLPKDATVNTEKRSVECAVNDESVRRLVKIILHLQTSPLLLFLMEKVRCIICRKESKGLRPLKSRHARLSIVANMSLIVNKRI